MELYVLDKSDLSILSIAKISEYQINLDEETNAKSTFTILKTEGLKEGNFLVLNGLYRQFLFIIPKDGVVTDKESNMATITALDISNIFDRKVIEKDTDTMSNDSIEEFIANTMSENFVNSDDSFLNISYIDIIWNTSTQGIVATNSENGLYNFHTFLINCRQYKDIYTDFEIDFTNKKLKITISHKTLDTEMIDTTLPEVVDYNKVYEEDVTAKVTVLIREDNSTYDLYLKTDRTTTTNKNDPDRASGNIEVISVDTADKAPTEALNVMKGNSYKHLVEFKIAKTSKLMDITKLTIGRPILIKTTDDIYSSYISAITLNDENFVYFKSGSIRINLLDKLKKTSETGGNKFDVTGGVITGDINIKGNIKKNGVDITEQRIITGVEYATTEYIEDVSTDNRVYRKKFYCGYLLNNDLKRIEIDLDLSEIEIVKLEGVGVRIDPISTFALPYASPLLESCITLNTRKESNKNYIEIRTGMDRTNMYAYVTLYYTKNE